MLATDIAVIENGTIVQAGKPAHVFQYPKSEFAARFSGFKNFFEGHIENDHNQKYFISGNTKFSFSNEEADGKGFVVIRSEDITLSLAKPETSARNCYLGKVLSIEPLHSNYEIIIDAGLQFSAYITSASLHELSIDIGMMVWISFKAFAVKFIEK